MATIKVSLVTLRISVSTYCSPLENQSSWPPMAIFTIHAGAISMRTLNIDHVYRAC